MENDQERSKHIQKNARTSPTRIWGWNLSRTPYLYIDSKVSEEMERGKEIQRLLEKMTHNMNQISKRW